MIRFAWLGAALAACTAGDVDTDDPFSDPPDISGRYQATLAGLTGCEDPASLVQVWFDGPLDVDGPAEDLVFDFGGGIELGGSVDADFGFQFGDDVDFEGHVLSVFGAGIAFSDSGGWALDGDLSVIVDDDCEIEGPFECVQVAS